jgi:hypothetical protein
LDFCFGSSIPKFVREVCNLIVILWSRNTNASPDRELMVFRGNNPKGRSDLLELDHGSVGADTSIL